MNDVATEGLMFLPTDGDNYCTTCIFIISLDLEVSFSCSTYFGITSVQYGKSKAEPVLLYFTYVDVVISFHHCFLDVSEGQITIVSLEV
jgi:hypothetical protein